MNFLVLLPLTLVNIHKVHSTRKELKCIIETCSNLLPLEAKDRMKKLDKRFAIALGLRIAMATIVMIYSVIDDGGEQAITLSLGYARTDYIASDPILSKLYTITGFLIPFICFYIFSGDWISVLYYTLIQYMVKEYANDCHRFIRDKMKEDDGKEIKREKNGKIYPASESNGKISTTDGDKIGSLFNQLLIRLKFYNDLVDNVNDTISLIPFTAQVIDFSFIIAGISFVVIYDSNFSVIFLIFTVGFMILFNLLLFHLWVKFSCDAFDTMRKVWKETVKLLSCPVMMTDRLNSCLDMTEKLHCRPDMMTRSESLSRLNVYISRGSISQSTVWNLFKIKRTLLLSFASQVIPFTIMIITTQFSISRKLG